MNVKMLIRFFCFFLPIVGQGDLFMLTELTTVSTAHQPGTGLVLTKHTLHGISYFANRTSKRRRADSTFLSMFSLHHDD